MNYSDFLALATSGQKPVIKIKSGITKSNVECEPLKETCTLRKKEQLGTEYALKYQSLQEQQFDNDEANTLEDVEGLTTITGTLPNPDEVLTEDLNNVYETYPFEVKQTPKLVVYEYQDEILENIESSQVIVIKGPTGCGKSTQVPQMILNDAQKFNVHCNIVITQPRRIAAISVAQRVAKERGWKIGSLVGYQIALEKKVSSDTRMLFCTTGVLLQQLVSQQSLTKYTHIIVDEVHERNMETDFLLILIKHFLRNASCRTKVILMSASVDTDKFVNYFSWKSRGIAIEPPVVDIASNVNFPVSIFYLEDLVLAKLPLMIPNVDYEEPKISPFMMEISVTLIEIFNSIDTSEHKNEFIGSVLIFLPGINEITEIHDCLKRRILRNEKDERENKVKWIVCPLHSTFTFEEQVSVFLPPPPNHRKIILATNIAESSITVPDVKYVIDFCLMKYLYQDPDSGYSALKVDWISKSQGIQRAGRVGRVMPGRVYRLVHKDMYEFLAEDSEPEMKRAPLDIVVLKAKQLAPESPPAKVLAFAMDPPDLSNILRTVLSLKLAGGLTTYTKGFYVEDDGDLTFAGHVMASLPLDISLTKLILLGHQFSMLRDTISIACAMSVRNVFMTPFKQQLEAYNNKIAWADSSCSDPIACKFAYDVWRKKKSDGFFNRSGGLSEKALGDRYFIQIKALGEVSSLVNEVTHRLKSLNITEQVNPIVQWNAMEKSLILKIIIAGAFYPNYFVRRPVCEKEAAKILGGRDPFKTCYMTGFPSGQPGPLYANAIKSHFIHCGSDIHVSFDGSSKVYLEFRSSTSDIELSDKPAQIPGNIEMALFRAIKLRQLNHSIMLPLLKPFEAHRRWEKLSKMLPEGDRENAKKTAKLMSHLPGFRIETLAVYISHKVNPNKFWVQIADEANQMRVARIFDLLNNRERSSLIPFKSNIEIGMLVAAPFSELGNEVHYYRAKVRAFGPGNSVQVFFIDYGNTIYVGADVIKDYGPRLIELNMKEDPEIAMECSLAEVQPSAMLNKNGHWSHSSTAEFDKYFRTHLNPIVIAQVYSVVNGVVSVFLFRNSCNLDFDFYSSFNYHLIKIGAADRCEESYLSRENHMQRELSKNRPELRPGVSLDFNDSGVYVPSPKQSECTQRATLKGPKSPLEMSLYCVTQNAANKIIQIDGTSVNAVLLDAFPMDPHERILVAGRVNTSTDGEKLILRQTTLMPNIHGLFALISMIFSPQVELRVDEQRTRLIGALCGLGYNTSTNQSFDPDNDIEVNFDVTFSYEDLENINKIRYWMNKLLLGASNWKEEFSNDADMLEGHKRIHELLKLVLLKKRPSQGILGHQHNYRWGVVKDKYLLRPSENVNITSNPSLYPLIWAVRLKEPTILSKEKIMLNMAKLTAIKLGFEKLTDAVCLLCNFPIDDLQSLNLHLGSAMHRSALYDFNKKHPSNS